eukprot:749385-Hanusia_phi.AAC.2
MAAREEDGGAGGATGQAAPAAAGGGEAGGRLKEDSLDMESFNVERKSLLDVVMDKAEQLELMEKLQRVLVGVRYSGNIDAGEAIKEQIDDCVKKTVAQDEQGGFTTGLTILLNACCLLVYASLVPSSTTFSLLSVPPLHPTTSSSTPSLFPSLTFSSFATATHSHGRPLTSNLLLQTLEGPQRLIVGTLRSLQDAESGVKGQGLSFHMFLSIQDTCVCASVLLPPPHIQTDREGCFPCTPPAPSISPRPILRTWTG